MTLSILLLDNDADSSEILQLLANSHLSENNKSVNSILSADNMETAIDVISHHKVDVILLNMTSINLKASPESSAQLRSIYLYSPIIGFTTNAQSIDLSEYGELGIDDCLDISILTTSILKRIIRSAINRSHSYQFLYANNQRRLISNQLLKLLLNKSSTKDVAQAATNIIQSQNSSNIPSAISLFSFDENQLPVLMAHSGKGHSEEQLKSIKSRLTSLKKSSVKNDQFNYSRSIIDPVENIARLTLPLISNEGISFILNMDIYSGLIHPSEERKYLKNLAETLSDILIRSLERERFDLIYQQNVRLIDQMSSAVIGIDKHDNVTHWNKLSETYFGMAKEDAMNCRLFELNINCDWPIIISELYDSLNENMTSKRFEVSYTRPKEENSRILSVAITPFIDPNGLYSGYLLLMDDITEKKHLEKIHQQSMYLESIGQLAAGIAHEINTPMQYIGDNLSFLQESFTDANKAISKIDSHVKKGTLTRNVMADILEEADYEYLNKELPLAFNQTAEGVSRVVAIVKAMKDFSHPNSENKVPTDLNKAIESTITISKHTWKYNADMEVDLDPSLPKVMCHPGPLNEVILNIIVNAADAISDRIEKEPDCDKGIIKVSSCTNKECAEITISDTGGGIPEHVQPKIFDPFFTTKEVGKGTGQGLALSYSIIKDRHKGELSFECEPGVGTTFTIRLPIEELSNNENRLQ